MAEAQLTDFPATAAALQALANDVKAGYIDQLKKHGHYTTMGDAVRLIDSVETVVTLDDRTFTVSLKLNEYWKYVEWDTRPHWPPPEAIRRWVDIKPVLPRPDANGKIPSPQSLAFLIGRKISKYGTTGTHDLQTTKDAVIPMHLERIEAALAEDIGNYIHFTFFT